ncbi:MAG: hypothetical protein EXS31_15580 [Pedosphaera sp.]|nr:hypothetical protein [Pedosphaera sp.]
MPIGADRAFIVPFFGSLLAFTYKEKAGDYFITTCLSVREINSLTLEDPVKIAYMHYGPAFTPPTDTSNWYPQPYAAEMYSRWKQRLPVVRVDKPPGPRETWWTYAAKIDRVTKVDGWLEGSWLEFMHQIHSPATVRRGAVTRHQPPPAPPRRKIDLSPMALLAASELLKRESNQL